MNAEHRRVRIEALVQLIRDDHATSEIVREAFIAISDELADLRQRVIQLQNKRDAA